MIDIEHKVITDEVMLKVALSVSSVADESMSEIMEEE